MTILVTGGAGFIDSAVIRYLIQHTPHTVINLDKLTYAGNLESLDEVSSNPRYHFEKAGICDAAAVNQILKPISHMRFCTWQQSPTSIAPLMVLRPLFKLTSLVPTPC